MSTKTNSKSFFSNSSQGQSQSNSVFDTLQNNDASSPLFTSSSNNSIGDFFKNITWQTWIIIIIVLAILGFNIFIYLAKGTQVFANVIEQVTSWFSGLFGNSASNTAKQTVNVSATGAKAAIDVGANTTTNAINRVSGSNSTSTIVPVGQTASSSQATTGSGNKVQTNTSVEQRQQDSLQIALNDANQSNNVQADDSYSAIQMSKSSGKAGWCLIGAEKGVRSCMEVGVNDQCMSGHIFPSQEICVNPRLRA
jgi:hypothetical protein